MVTLQDAKLFLVPNDRLHRNRGVFGQYIRLMSLHENGLDSDPFVFLRSGRLSPG